MVMVVNPDGSTHFTTPPLAATAEAAKKREAEEAERGKPLTAAQKEVAVQCFALKLLSGGCQVPGQGGVPWCQGWGWPLDGAVLEGWFPLPWPRPAAPIPALLPHCVFSSFFTPAPL